MSNIKNRFRIGLIQKNALELRRNYQLPFQLVQYIMQINVDTEPDKVAFLLELTKHYLRVKGYYKTYKDIEDTSNSDIRNTYERRYN